MTVSGAWSRYRRARPPKSPRLGRWQQVLADALDQNLAIGVRAAVADHLGRAPTQAELIAARRAAHSLAALGGARVFYVPGADADANAGDRNHLVLAKPNVIMNDTRLRGLAVAGSDAAGRRSPHNHAQTARNLRRSLRNAAAGARLIEAEGLNSKSAADISASLANAIRASDGFDGSPYEEFDHDPFNVRDAVASPSCRPREAHWDSGSEDRTQVPPALLNATNCMSHVPPPVTGAVAA